MKSLRYVFAAALVGAGLSAPVAHADAISDFYKGKRMILVIGSGPGTNFDGYGRMLARHIVNHIPGTPSMIVQNKPGATSIIAVNHVYNVAPQDGSVLLGPNRVVSLSRVLGHKGAQFEPDKLNWLGSLAKEAGAIYVARDLPIKSVGDVRKTEVLIGATAPDAENVVYPALMNNTLGTKFKIITGYESLNAQFLAFARGEVKGMESSFSSMARKYKDWRNEVTVLVQLGLSKDPAMPDVPQVFDMIKPENIMPGMTVEEVTTLWRVIVTPNDMGRPYATGPQVPADRVKALRAAFQATLKDGAFLEEAKKSRRELDPISGDEIQAMIEKVAALPKSVIDKLNEEIKYRAPK